jgi:hypothetical protein
MWHARVGEYNTPFSWEEVKGIASWWNDAKWIDNIQMDFKEIGCKVVDLFLVADDRSKGGFLWIR